MLLDGQIVTLADSQDQEHAQQVGGIFLALDVVGKAAGVIKRVVLLFAAVAMPPDTFN
jgi:hypothetical protein